ncbi:hypothetical protein B296_00047182 [Ensete ventricosum]|uniref:Uncharacterized protein n=1 Tax=Ensete ventricosum TaxID=4639 RepID=A0A426Z0R4_ENSVE|nr:hypothetical protein B296_00047182 [Ensete ventricosum]
MQLLGGSRKVLHKGDTRVLMDGLKYMLVNVPATFSKMGLVCLLMPWKRGETPPAPFVDFVPSALVDLPVTGLSPTVEGMTHLAREVGFIENSTEGVDGRDRHPSVLSRRVRLRESYRLISPPLNEELRADVQKLKDEFGPVAVATVEAQANEATVKLEEVQHKKSRPSRSYEFGYKIALTHFRTKHMGLEVEEDPYASLVEDDNVLMEVEVPFDDSDPTAM